MIIIKLILHHYTLIEEPLFDDLIKNLDFCNNIFNILIVRKKFIRKLLIILYLYRKIFEQIKNKNNQNRK